MARLTLKSMSCSPVFGTQPNLFGLDVWCAFWAARFFFSYLYLP
jgi:hypothetical protein